MDPITVITSQAPPAAVQTGKPAGPSPQLDETGPNFKEVLNKKKLEDEQVQATSGAMAGLMTGAAPVQIAASQTVVKVEGAEAAAIAAESGTQKMVSVQAAAVTENDVEVDASEMGQKQGYFGKPAVDIPTAMSPMKTEQPDVQKVVILPDHAKGANQAGKGEMFETVQPVDAGRNAEVQKSEVAQPTVSAVVPAQAHLQTAQIPAGLDQEGVNIETLPPAQNVRPNPVQTENPSTANRPLLINSEQAAVLLRDVDLETARILNVKSAAIELDLTGHPFVGEVKPEIQYELDSATGMASDQTGQTQAGTSAETLTSQNVMPVEPQTIAGNQAETLTNQPVTEQPVASQEALQMQTAAPTAAVVNSREMDADPQVAQKPVQSEVSVVIDRQTTPEPRPVQDHAEPVKRSDKESQLPIQPVQPSTEHSHATAMQTGLNQEGGLGHNQDRSTRQADVNVSKNNSIPVAQTEKPVSVDTIQSQSMEVGFGASVLQNGNIQSSQPAALPQIGAENLQRIVDQVGLTLQTGRKVARIQLNPQDLGTIDIQLTSDANGVKVTILTEQASTGRLLERDMNTLRQSLQDAGLNLTHLHFGMKEQQAQSGQHFLQNNSAWSGKRWNQNTWNTAGDAQNESIQASTRVASLSTSLIDYKI